MSKAKGFEYNVAEKDVIINSMHLSYAVYPG